MPPRPCLDRFIGPAVLPGCFTTAFFGFCFFDIHGGKTGGRHGGGGPVFFFLLFFSSSSPLNPSPAMLSGDPDSSGLAHPCMMNALARLLLALFFFLSSQGRVTHIFADPSAGEPPRLAECLPKNATTDKNADSTHFPPTPLGACPGKLGGGWLGERTGGQSA
ncbi:hypothetical protein LZ32DRAFT_373931 [Colletotrichum eremochloae]|nr:hypothetical protein LZ32DRAFT_373931 [Colletotrichum eremochloae]